jgi:hypothetical protein
VHPVGKLDDHDAAFAGRANEPPRDCARSFAELAEHDVHDSKLSIRIASVEQGKIWKSRARAPFL